MIFFKTWKKNSLRKTFQVHTPNFLDKNVRVSKIQLVISQKQTITLKTATPEDDLTVHRTFDSSAPVDWTCTAGAQNRNTIETKQHSLYLSTFSSTKTRRQRNS